MFLFNRKPRKSSVMEQRLEAKQHNRMVAQQQDAMQPQGDRNEPYRQLAEHADACNNIAVYFNQQHRDVPGYEMSIRLKTQEGSQELAHPFRVNQGMIMQIQESPDVYLEGHVRTPEGLMKDIYDSAYPAMILRERYGERDTLAVDDLPEYERQRVAAKPHYGPTSHVVYKDDVMDIPIGTTVPKSQDHSL